MTVVDNLRAWVVDQGGEQFIEPAGSEWVALRIRLKTGVAVIYRDKKNKLKPDDAAQRLLACQNSGQPWPIHMRPAGLMPPTADGKRTLTDILGVYEGSNGDVTKAMYVELAALGPAGVIAMNLFRAQKCSARAKLYKGGRGGYTGIAYDRKSWSLGLLCEALTAHGANLGVAWGWGIDRAAVNFENVLYVDLPTGQVSFHNPSRKTGPEYLGQWDGVRSASTERICRYVRDTINGDAGSISAETSANTESDEAISTA